MVQLPGKSALDRATIIRNHLEPLILAASDGQLNGTPLFFMVAGFMIFYRRHPNETRLEVVRGRRLLKMRWNAEGASITTFHPGDWERAITALRAV